MKIEAISSKNNPTVKWASSLSDKKGRDESSAFMVEGLKLSLEAIRSLYPVSHILLREDNASEFLPIIEGELQRAEKNDARIVILSDIAFEKITTEKAPQGIITVLKKLDFSNIADIIYKEDFFSLYDEKSIVLASLRDPSNIGAVIRTAAALRFDRIILSSDCADVFSPKALRSAMGGIFKLKISYVSSVCEFVKKATEAGRRVFAAELSETARAISEIHPSARDFIIIGNEGHGIDTEVSSLCTGSVFIPINPDVESLNASVAAAILMWEQSKNC